MSASFEEKSVWMQAAATLLGMATYFTVAGRMMADGVTALPAYAGLFIGAVVLMVVILAAGHAAAAISERPTARDERDRLIAWRAESGSSWVLAAGAVLVLGGMLAGVENVWTAHLLLLSLFLSALLGYALRIIYYRRGV